MSDAGLVVAPCSHKAARHAVTRWHYSQRMPVGKSVRYGVWEHGRFVGALIFSRGATPNLPKPYGLTQAEVVELTRVALRDHTAPVTQIVAAALERLRAANPGLRLVVSFADPNHGHHGGIYQAGNWIYLGQTAGKVDYVDAAGRVWHDRQVKTSGWCTEFGKVKRAPKRSECTQIPRAGKHRYAYPLDKPMRRQLNRRAKPYPPAPRGRSLDGETAGPRPASAGSTPAVRSNAAVNPPAT